ncbi:MAG: hypothetical protein K6L75_05095 [Cellvibrionaceae bacterium]
MEDNYWRSPEKKQEAFDEKFGKELREAILSKETLDDLHHEPENDDDMRGLYGMLAIDTHIKEVYKEVTSEEVMDKIEKLMENTGQTPEELSKQLAGADLQISEKLDELLEQSRSQGFAAKLDSERKAAEQDPDKGDQGRG